MNRKLAAVTIGLLLHPLAWADSSYQSTTQMTGGMLVNTLKSSPFMPSSMKSMLEPTTTTTVVHGNQKAVISRESTEIFDIDKETFTRIDNAKKTYTVITFDQMRQMMKDMPQKLAAMEAKMKQEQAQAKSQPAPQFTMTFDTQVKNPGVSKVVNGLNAEERMITLTTRVTNANPAPNDPVVSITYITTTDIWIAPEPPEMQEIQDFDVRMYTKLSQGMDMKALMEQMKAAASNAGMGMMFGNRPGASEAMAEMEKEIAKIKGIRVLEVTTISGAGLPATPAAPAGSAPPPTDGSVAGQAATDAPTPTSPGESSKTGIFGNALASSAFSAFHRKKSTPPPTAAPAATGTAAAPGSGSDPNALMTTTTQKTNFSRDAVPASAFQIPAGYKQVQSPSGMF